MIYLDNSATTFPKPISVINAVNESLRRYSANPGRSGHKLSMITAQKVFECRNAVCRLFNLDNESKVIFTLGCTQSLNTVIKGVLKPGDHCVISCLEHNSVVRPLEKLKEKGVTYSVATVYPLDNDKTLDSFRNCINEKTKLIVCTHASNVFGFKLRVERICALAHEYGVLFCLDAAQTAGVVKIDLKKNNFDFVCCAGHKGLYGPMGIGLLIINCDVIPDTLIEGGTGSNSQSFLQPDFLPDRFESGTQNIIGICGLKKGIDFVLNKNTDNIYKSEMSLIRNLYKMLSLNKNVKLYTQLPDLTHNVPVLSFSFKKTDSETVASYLDTKYSIATRAGMHCAILAHKFMKTSDHGTVRVSPSVFNNQNDINTLVNAINKL